MALGKIPVLALFLLQMIAFRYLLQDGPNDDVVHLNPRFAQYIGAKHAVMVPLARYGLIFLCDGCWRRR